MNATDRHCEPRVTPELVAEASAWVAILHGANRTQAVERGFSDWLKRSASHAQAFEEITDIWVEAKDLKRFKPLRVRHERSRGFGIRLFAGAAAAIGFAGILLLAYVRNCGISTGIGEQRVLALEDGTRVFLNTQTRVVITYDHKARHIALKHGEAVFEVAKRPGWPFIVEAGNRQVRALGTSFAVRREGDQVAVALVEGKVSISPIAARHDLFTSRHDTQNLSARREGSIAPRGPGPEAAAQQEPDVYVLAPGQRLRFTGNASPTLDKPRIDKLLAWERHEVALDNATLTEAIAEMNRYSGKPIVAEVPQPDTIRVTGLFQAGESMSFAQAVAEAYRLRVVEKDDQIRITDEDISRANGSVRDE